MNIFYGFLLGTLIGLISWRMRALSISGAAAAAITGGLIFGIGGLPWAALLLTFFVSSTILSKLFKRRKAVFNEKFSKGSVRDWGQVLANGGLGALLAIGLAIQPESGWLWAAFGGAMAAVNADTWATELGVLAKKEPRIITTGQRVAPGTSGAVSGLGYLAALGGAVFVAMIGSLFPPAEGTRLGFAAAAVLGGLAGSSFDSFLGATIQTIYHCPQCDKETERHPRHLCGCETQYLRGWRWLNNDLVNFACSAAGAAAASIFWMILY